MKTKPPSALKMHGVARFYLARLRERLWLKPLLSCLFSIAAVLCAGVADRLVESPWSLEISAESLETLLSIMSASMLVIAMFSVGAMLSAYSSASNSATPRSFPLVVGDDVSQNALSTFIGAFIFSIIGLVALLNGYYESSGRLVLFVVTLLVFAIVVLAFVRWVDRIARLGRLGHTIDKVEDATNQALQLWARQPTMGARPIQGAGAGEEVCAQKVGYVQNIDLAQLQRIAEQSDCRINVCAVPGSFLTPDQPLARLEGSKELPSAEVIEKAFVIGGDRTFESDPRFGLTVLSEIASRALSPAVNDPGTAIDIIGSVVRLLIDWVKTCEDADVESPQFDRVAVPELAVRGIFDDAFSAVARDGAGSVEVASRLQRAYAALASLSAGEISSTAVEHSALAMRYAEKSLLLDEELQEIRAISKAIREKHRGGQKTKA